MLKQYRSSWKFQIFIARTFVLFFLIFHVYLYLSSSLSIVFTCTVFVLCIAAAVLMEKLKLRIIPAIIMFCIFLWASREAAFLGFTLQQYIFNSPEVDFQFFLFDRNFFPLIVPSVLVWFFTFVSLRKPGFIIWEAGISTALFVAVLWSQAGYEISLYPHPVFLAVASGIFILTEVFIIFSSRNVSEKGNVIKEYSPKKRSSGFLSFLWVVLPLLIICLVFLLGRYTSGAVKEGGGLLKPTFFRFDFSKYVRLESEISLNDDLVLLFRKQGPADRILLRRFVLSGYRPGSGFFHEYEPGEKTDRVTVPDSTITLPDPEYKDRIEIEQEYFLINFDPSSLVAMNYPVKVIPLINWDSSSFLRIYRIISKVSAFYPWELMDSEPPDMEEMLLDYYTEYGDDPDILKLAEDITSESENYYDRVMAILRFLQDNYYYSLKPGIAEDGNQLNHFLFESKKGYCSYFAFSMALLCRSIGIPARVSVGFFVDPGMEVLNFYPVRADMAHAWIEVYFTNYGWIEFDPTSNVLAPGEEYEFAGFEVKELATLIEEIMNNQNSLEEQTSGGIKPPSIFGQWKQKTVRGLKLILKLWYFTVPVLYILIICGIRISPWACFLLSHRKRRKTAYLFNAALHLPYGLGWIRTRNESILEYSERIHLEYKVNMSLLVNMYLRAVFAKDFDDTAFKEALSGYLIFKKEFREKIPWYLRIAAFFNPLGSLRRKG